MFHMLSGLGTDEKKGTWRIGLHKRVHVRTASEARQLNLPGSSRNSVGSYSGTRMCCGNRCESPGPIVSQSLKGIRADKHRLWLIQSENSRGS